MARLHAAIAIIVSNLLAFAVADSGNKFIFPGAYDDTSNQISTTIYEGAGIVVQWETTWEYVGLWMTQEGNPASVPFPNARTCIEELID